MHLKFFIIIMHTYSGDANVGNMILHIKKRPILGPSFLYSIFNNKLHILILVTIIFDNRLHHFLIFNPLPLSNYQKADRLFYSPSFWLYIIFHLLSFIAFLFLEDFT